MKGLQGWTRILEESESAVLSALLKELDRITASDESSAIQLADVILKDASLTSNVIRIASSVKFNPSGLPVTTVSRAILNIGFKHIRTVCLSIKVLETVLEDSPSPVLVAMLARTLHGAVQAKSLCSNLPDHEQEEVFVASLLCHLAEMLVLGSKEEDAIELKQEISAKSGKLEKNQAAERILGVSMTRLSTTLMKHWHIEGVVNEVLLSPGTTNEMAKAVMLGDEISRASLYGWDSQEFKAIASRVAKFKNCTVAEISEKILSAADDAADTISEYGRDILTEHIPSRNTNNKAIESNSSLNDSSYLKADPEIQLKVLQNLASLIDGEFDINSAFKFILTGLNKGVGLERVAIGIFDQTQENLVAKYVMGIGTETWRENFVLKYESSHSSFLYQLFEKDQAIWVGSSEDESATQHIKPEIAGITGSNLFFIAPLSAKGKKVGLIYADLGCSNRDFNQVYFDGFNHFVLQTKLALNVLASNK